VVHLGSKVTLHDLETHKERTIALVGSFEADPLQDLISILSPLGEALLAKSRARRSSSIPQKASCATESCASSSRNDKDIRESPSQEGIMARVTLLIGLSNGQEIDCPINSREEAQQVIEQLRRSDDLVDLPGICYIRASGSSELGARGVVAVHPQQVVYTQLLGVDE
jgi:hypothetical protein